MPVQIWPTVAGDENPIRRPTTTVDHHPVKVVGAGALDGRDDLVAVLAAGAYDADVGSVWSTGDFNGDGWFRSSDLVESLSDGGYDRGPRAATAVVPEPTTLTLTLMLMLMRTAMKPCRHLHTHQCQHQRQHQRQHLPIRKSLYSHAITNKKPITVA